MSKHTPEQWEIANEIHGLGGIVASLGQTVEGKSYFVRSPVLVRDEDLPANASLIAASPKLLRAAKDLLDFVRAKYPNSFPAPGFTCEHHRELDAAVLEAEAI